MASTPASELTEKQAETMELLSEGYTSKHIAARCGISPQAVDRRIQGLLRKTACMDRRELIQWHRQQAGLSPAAETNLGIQPEEAASSNSERFTVTMDEAGGSAACLSSCRTMDGSYPETHRTARRGRIARLILDAEITWMEVALAILLFREVYKILA